MTAINELRLMHRPGNAELATAVAFARAAHREDFDALLALTQGLGPDDDAIGLIVWLSLLAGGALARHPDPDAFLDTIATAERDGPPA